MNIFSSRGKTYDVDSEGFLVNYDSWDENFAEAMASEAKVPGRLTPEHWRVLRFIRETFKQTGTCPLVYQTCKANGLQLKDLKRLFPAGYLRGACKLSGITYKERLVDYYGEKESKSREAARPGREEKVYRVNVQGFLVDPAEWDENFAIHKAQEMKMKEGLTDKHWSVIHFVRDYFKDNGTVPSLFETCETNQMELDEMEGLFPDGYHRGVVKIAGLRAR